jgi:hypothetical protein
MSDSQQWYMSMGGHQVGPVSAEDIISNIRNGSMQPNTYVFTPGMKDWIEVSKVEFFKGYFSEASKPVTIPMVPGRTAHESISRFTEKSSSLLKWNWIREKAPLLKPER